MSRRGFDNSTDTLLEKVNSLLNLEVVKRTMSWGGFDLLPKSLPK